MVPASDSSGVSRVAARVRRAPLRFWRFDGPLPSLRIAVAQLALSSVEWTLLQRATCCSPDHLSFLGFLGAFLLAVPSAWRATCQEVGVFEGLMAVLLHRS